jgi:DNA-binding transcriptional LysR family regulator
MELRQLSYFVTVAHERSFTRAAARLYVAQPGVSQQIRRLEEELGARLFDRSGKQPRLTAAGEALLPHARDALAASDAGRAALAALVGVVTGRVQIGTIPGIPNVDVPSLLSTFHIAYPRVEITLAEGQPVSLIEGLRHDDYDAVIVGLSSPDPPDGLSVEVISAEPLVLVTNPKHPLAPRVTVSIPELRSETFVTLTRGSALRRGVEQACDAAGFAAHIALETTDVRLLCELVGEGLGVTVVPRSIADHGAAAGVPLSIVGLDPPIVTRYTALAWRTDREQAPAAHAFLATARTWVNERRAPAANPRRAAATPPAGDTQTRSEVLGWNG